MKQNIIKFLISTVLVVIMNSIFAANSFEKVNIDSSLKNKILKSNLNISLRASNNQKIRAYLYADDEKKEEIAETFRNSDEKKIIMSTGHYFIYLYNVEKKYFYPYRTKIFERFGDTSFNIEGSFILRLADVRKKNGDVLLISQFGASTWDIYEGFGFSKNKEYLLPYSFVGANRESSFYGMHMNDKSGVYMYGIYGDKGNHHENLKLEVSDKYGEIKVLNLDRK